MNEATISGGVPPNILSLSISLFLSFFLSFHITVDSNDDLTVA